MEVIIQSSNEGVKEFDFAFCFGGNSQVPADELFDGGKIRPLKLLPRSHNYQHNIATYSPRSPRSPKRMLTKPTSMTHPTLVKETSKDTKSSGSGSGSGSSSSSSRRWKLTDLFISLGSTSEKNVTNKDDSASILRNHKKDTNEWSFRSESSSKSGSSSSRGGACRRKGRVSAHEWHYKQNRAAAEERRRKTFLPYKKGLLGCIDVETSGVLEFSRGHGVEITC